MSIIKKARISADKRSIDAYGRSVEIAIANYLLDNGDFPTDILQLSVEYSGDRVECSTTQLNSDSTIYLAGCTVEGRNVEGYIYGKEGTITYNAYSIGDEVTYNGVDYYVIENSGDTKDTVTMLKAEPIKSADVVQYISSSELNGKIKSDNKYIQLSYYTADNCKSASSHLTSGCSSDYGVSDIKQIVDIWKNNYLIEKDLAIDSTGYSVRLLTNDELFNNLGYNTTTFDGTSFKINYDNTPSWVYNENYEYWTMGIPDNMDFSAYMINNNGNLVPVLIYVCDIVYFNDKTYTVRPVVTLKKSALN